MIAVDVHNILLCGTNYGQVYLSAIHQSPSLELAGLLAKGSARSVRMAEQNGVPLYRQVAELDEPISLACVAVGEERGLPMALSLLERQVPVLIEHPIGKSACLKLFETAEAHGAHCHINGHFADLPPASDFVATAQKINKAYQPLMISCSANGRTLYSLLDMLMRSFGVFELEDFELKPLNQLYTACSFLLNGIPVNLSFQNWKGEQDDSRDAPLGHQITVTYPIGTLLLTGTYGACIWNPLVAAIPNGQVPCSFQSSNIEQDCIAQIEGWRTKANQKSIEQLLAVATENGQVPEEQSPACLLALTGIWTTIMSPLRTQFISSIPDVIPERFWNPLSELRETQPNRKVGGL